MNMIIQSLLDGAVIDHTEIPQDRHGWPSASDAQKILLKMGRQRVPYLNGFAETAACPVTERVQRVYFE